MSAVHFLLGSTIFWLLTFGYFALSVVGAVEIVANGGSTRGALRGVAISVGAYAAGFVLVAALLMVSV